MLTVKAIQRRIRRPGPLAALAVAYIAAVSGVMIWRGISVSPDYLLLILVPVAVLSGRFNAFVRDWVPFVALFLGYEAMWGIAPKTGIGPHITDVIHAETALFGGVDPSAWLQARLGTERWLVIVCTVIYFCHFAFPIAVGMVLWLVDRTKFLRYVVALMGMSFAAFIIFLLVPTAPPWLAHDWGYLPGVSKLMNGALPSAISPYYRLLDSNPVAAFPSLHAAYPLLGALALWTVSRRAGLLTLAWCCAVWFSVVFLGEHYVVDVLGGIVFAAGSWLVMERVVVPHVRVLRAQPEAAVAVGATGAVAVGTIGAAKASEATGVSEAVEAGETDSAGSAEGSLRP
jgi:PAP2 superfamily